MNGELADYMKLKACWWLHVQDTIQVKMNKTKTKKTRKWHQIVLLITNTCDIIAFSTVANRQLGYKQMLMTY